MNKGQSREFEEEAKVGNIAKLNMHSVLAQKEIVFPCPHCAKLVKLRIDINERSSAVYFSPIKP
jgi:hypothetical protein